MSSDNIIFLFNNALRVRDNELFANALKNHETVVAAYLYDPDRSWSPGAASLWWLHHSLSKLSDTLKEDYQLPLVLKKGVFETELENLIDACHASDVYVQYQVPELHRIITQTCQKKDVHLHTGWEHFLKHPEAIETKSGGPYKVFTPFWRTCEQNLSIQRPTQKPLAGKIETKAIKGDRLEDWNLLPTKPNWAKEFEKEWQPGEDGARSVLSHFLDNDAVHYDTARDFPGKQNTSRLSPYLHHGEISPRQIYFAVQHRMDSENDSKFDKNARSFLREIGWREFCYHLLYHFQDMPEKGMNDKFDAFPWRSSKKDFKAWQQGKTGYPLVDAGMRQLWQTGWMHNRVRMVVGSFLVKNLRINWIDGEKWFWNTLVDADLANNAGGWQWVAGCGADAAPYFRIFNPVTQSEKFDPKGTYIRRFVPELKDMPDKYIHAPWMAPKDILEKASVELGENYPHPMLDAKKTRQEALDAYKSLS